MASILYRMPGTARAGLEAAVLLGKTLITLAAAVATAAAGACTSLAAVQTARSQPALTISGSPGSGGAGENGRATASAPRDAIASRSTASAPALKVLTEPADGLAAIYKLIGAARSSVDLTMYELADTTAEKDLAAAAARGVDVRVLLDRHFEKSANRSAYRYLAARGVHVRWGPAATTVHQKTLTVNNATSVIMTLNLTSRYYAGTRDFAVIDRNHADVAAIVATFNADFAGRAVTPPDGADLVWSPTNAQSSVLSVINGASHTLSVEDEEMDDPAVTSALARAARRGVDVKVVMTANSDWDPAFSQLVRAGVHVRLYADDSRALYIHAKVILADAGRAGRRALIGSQNFSVASLDYNRELGILTTSRPVIAAVNATVARDYAGATPYHAKKKAAGAWCTATASVYNASRDWNNVYVHSNQPHRTATARADGYSHSYETSGSGYALIYLNGPPAGARFTVTVGAATCTASD
jgi:cardiolipin synthase